MIFGGMIAAIGYDSVELPGVSGVALGIYAMYDCRLHVSFQHPRVFDRA